MAKKILVASDSFKGSATSLEIGTAIKEGIQSLYPDDEVEVFEIADGGEGTTEALMAKVSGSWERVWVQNPLGELRKASYGLFDQGKSAIIEVAEASGLTTVPEDRRQIMVSNSYGTGQLLAATLSHQPERLYIGLGGSATNDGGLGLLAALGMRFLDGQGVELPPLPTSLGEIAELDLTHFQAQPKNLEIIVLSDVTNPLCGPFGASAIFAPQKGASAKDIDVLDAGLAHFAELCANVIGKDCKELAGAGAAGGLGFALMTFFDVTVLSGVEVLLDLVGFDQALTDADLVITGEGRMDSQSLQGKAPLGVAKRAAKYAVPTVALVGAILGDREEIYQSGLSGVFPIVDGPVTLGEAMERTPELVFKQAQAIASFFHSIS